MGAAVSFRGHLYLLFLLLLLFLLMLAAHPRSSASHEFKDNALQSFS
jgi:hypothetical protein